MNTYTPRTQVLNQWLHTAHRLVVLDLQYQSNQPNQQTFWLKTPIVYTEVILTWRVQEFVKGKPKWKNPAIMGNPINMNGVNKSKNNQSY